MKHKIITISRQFGSGGRTIGKELAKKLGIPCYDRELIEMVAKESGFSEEYIQENSEHTMNRGLLSSIFSDRVYDTPYTQDVIWNVQEQVICKLAEKGPCVIVGRCADYILREKADCMCMPLRRSGRSVSFASTENGTKRLKSALPTRTRDGKLTIRSTPVSSGAMRGTIILLWTVVRSASRSA